MNRLGPGTSTTTQPMLRCFQFSESRRASISSIPGKACATIHAHKISNQKRLAHQFPNMDFPSAILNLEQLMFTWLYRSPSANPRKRSSALVRARRPSMSGIVFRAQIASSVFLLRHTRALYSWLGILRRVPTQLQAALSYQKKISWIKEGTRISTRRSRSR